MTITLSAYKNDFFQLMKFDQTTDKTQLNEQKVKKNPLKEFKKCVKEKYTLREQKVHKNMNALSNESFSSTQS